MGPALLVADDDDRIAEVLRRRLRGAVAVPAREGFPRTHFTLGNDGALVDGAIAVDGRWLELGALSGVLFRPGRAWRRRRAATTVRQAFNRHERRAAWSAWLAALPCTVANRLPPAWFIAPDLHRQALSRSFAAAAGLAALSAGGVSLESSSRMYFVGGAFVGSGIGIAAPVRPLQDCREDVERWCAGTGILLGRIDLSLGRDGLEVAAVEPVPSLRDETDTVVDRLCRLLASRFA